MSGTYIFICEKEDIFAAINDTSKGAPKKNWQTFFGAPLFKLKSGFSAAIAWAY
ncbi:hypothetical protein SAMN05421743_10769 [Thalassobacillus cyri]|uniref:Uncharacterized protein n=1 Tax=Thalassobacillus cyri TaxID=571932 RepID=A0A1H4DBP3_9BACI|nr:hypothetical protein SAMN05421743_10769 [Thalassobacillus cyri]